MGAAATQSPTNVPTEGLTEFRQRVRDVRQGPDGFVYLLTEENPGALLKLDPVQ